MTASVVDAAQTLVLWQMQGGVGHRYISRYRGAQDHGQAVAFTWIAFDQASGDTIQGLGRSDQEALERLAMKLEARLQ